MTPIKPPKESTIQRHYPETLHPNYQVDIDNEIHTFFNQQHQMCNLHVYITVQDALKSQEADKWKEAMIIETKALIANDTWELIHEGDWKVKPDKILKSLWVLNQKRDFNGTPIKKKAKVVIDGSQQPDIRFDQT